VTRFIRLHPGAQKGSAANYWSLFEPHYKQNLSANPKRTAKSSFTISDALHLNFVQIIFPSRKIFLKELLTESNNSQPFTVRTEQGLRQVTQTFLWKIFSMIFYNFLRASVFMPRTLGHQPSRRFPRARYLPVMRAIWKGSISFSLINIPIALYPATRREELKFRLLRGTDLSPVNYKRVAEADGKE